jgi:UDP-2-acetamido-3-amino-2,3-dideoxy-glucuronate N-acetyltransferase
MIRFIVFLLMVLWLIYRLQSSFFVTTSRTERLAQKENRLWPKLLFQIGKSALIRKSIYWSPLHMVLTSTVISTSDVTIGSPDLPNIAVIGAGYWGKNLLRNFHELGSLRAFCENDETRRNFARDNYPKAKAYQTVEQVASDPDIDAVAISTPAVTHAELARLFINAGKHVFVEKPLCLHAEEGEALGILADASDRVLMVGHLLLYHPAFRALQAFVKSDEIGKLRYIYSNRLSLGKIRTEENALWSFAPHDISMILALTGELPQTVTAMAANYITDGVADTTLSHLKFSEDLQAHIYVSWLHPFKDHRLVVTGSKGTIVFDDTSSGDEKLLYYPHPLSIDDGVPVFSKAPAEAVPYDQTAEPLRLECSTFLECVANKTRPPSDAEEGVRVLRTLEACEAAIISGQPYTIGG